MTWCSARVIEVMTKERDPALITAKDLMGGELVTVGEGNDGLRNGRADARQGGEANAGGRRSGRTGGIVTLDDLLRIIGEQLALLARVIARERLQERRSPR